MGQSRISKMLSNRKIWQDRANSDGIYLENIVREILEEFTQGDHLIIIQKRPHDLKGIYDGRRGTVPDIAIRNKQNRKSVYLEVKQQGAQGNAHERACKFFAPGILGKAEKISNTERPFYFIFAGGMIDDPDKSGKYHAEIDTYVNAPGWYGACTEMGKV